MGKPKTDAARYLYEQFIEGDAELEAVYEAYGLNTEIAAEIYDMRTAAGLTQSEMARLVGTTQSVISRLEDADYEGHSLSMLQRIAAALGKRVKVTFVPLGGEEAA